MLGFIRTWFNRYFSNPEASMLVILLVLGFSFVLITNKILAPIFTGVILAYLLQSVVNALESCKVKHSYAVSLVFLGFLSLFFIVLLGFIPLMWEQFLTLFQELPKMLDKGHAALYGIQEKFPRYISKTNVDTIIGLFADSIQQWGKSILAVSLNSIPNIITYIVYLVLLPLIVFFLLKDKKQILTFGSKFLPKKRDVITRIWREVDLQIGNYIRGKAIEVAIMTAITFVGFWALGMPYASLLSVLVGLSVLVPYAGAAVITVPVVFIGLFHYGISQDFMYLLTFYIITQILDANVLIPILFYKAVNLHPLIIIVSVLFFGGIFGVLGVFYAIPLAVLIKAVWEAWPENKE